MTKFSIQVGGNSKRIQDGYIATIRRGEYDGDRVRITSQETQQIFDPRSYHSERIGEINSRPGHSWISYKPNFVDTRVSYVEAQSESVGVEDFVRYQDPISKFFCLGFNGLLTKTELDLRKLKDVTLDLKNGSGESGIIRMEPGTFNSQPKGLVLMRDRGLIVPYGNGMASRNGIPIQGEFFDWTRENNNSSISGRELANMLRENLAYR